MSKQSRNSVLSKEELVIVQQSLDLSKKEFSVPAEAIVSAVHIASNTDDRLIGSWLTIDGPTVRRSHGPEPSYRYWFWMSEPRLFATVSELYTFLCTKLRTSQYRCGYAVYRQLGDGFERSGTSPETIDLARYAAKALNPILAAVFEMSDADLRQRTSATPADLARVRLALISWATERGTEFTSVDMCVDGFMRCLVDTVMRKLDPADITNYGELIKELLAKGTLANSRSLVYLTQVTTPGTGGELGDYLGTWLTVYTDAAEGSTFWLWLDPDWNMTRYDSISELTATIKKEHPKFVTETFSPNDWRQIYRGEAK